jgi:hypothetical protein
MDVSSRTKSVGKWKGKGFKMSIEETDKIKVQVRAKGRVVRGKDEDVSASSIFFRLCSLRPRQNTTRNPKDRVWIAERVKDARGWEGSKDVFR